jgi:hypothetical protein
MVISIFPCDEFFFFIKKILKILKEYSEAISQRRADNTMNKKTSNDLPNTK